MKNLYLRSAAILLMTLTFSAAGYAQQPVTLTDTSQTTTLTANVSEQARVTVPAGVLFNVTDVLSATAASGPATVTVQGIVLASATKQLTVSIQANAASFTPPSVGDATWSASDVTWNAAAWSNATGAAGALSNAAYAAVATCDADAASCSTSDLVLTLGGNAAVKRAGDHTLVVTWKFESIGS